MGTRLYLLPDGDRDGKKVWYLLDLDMGMGMNFFYGDGYGIAKPVPTLPRCHPYLLGLVEAISSSSLYLLFSYSIL